MAVFEYRIKVVELTGCAGSRPRWFCQRSSKTSCWSVLARAIVLVNTLSTSSEGLVPGAESPFAAGRRPKGDGAKPTNGVSVISICFIDLRRKADDLRSFRRIFMCAE